MLVTLRTRLATSSQTTGQGCSKAQIKHTLSKPVLWKVGNQFRSMADRNLGDLNNTCLQRMQGWQNLAMFVLQAEFPDFELCNAFVIFCLGGAASSGGGAAPPAQAELEMWCRKLAHGIRMPLGRTPLVCSRLVFCVGKTLLYSICIIFC
eukprot:4951047-Amphidinium_carterae.2